jgi:hypothetical protein
MRGRVAPWPGRNSHAFVLFGDMAREGRTRRLDRAVAAFAAGQHGVVAWPQLARLGMSRDGLRTRVAARRLHVLHRGVYAVVGSPLLRIEGHWLAAVLAVGDRAVLSHRSAAALWDLLPAGAGDPEVAVARMLKRREGIRLHCIRSLPKSHVNARNGIPCTTVARTLADLAAVLPPRRLERALGQAEVLRLYNRTEIEAVLAANPRRPGSRTLRALLGVARPVHHPHAKPAGGAAAHAVRPRWPTAAGIQRSLHPARRHGDLDRCVLVRGRPRRRAR